MEFPYSQKSCLNTEENIEISTIYPVDFPIQRCYCVVKKRKEMVIVWEGYLIIHTGAGSV